MFFSYDYLVGVDLVESSQDIQDTLLDIRTGKAGGGVSAGKVQGHGVSGNDGGGSLVEGRRAVEGSGADGSEHGWMCCWVGGLVRGVGGSREE